ncbi:unnamed protein product [Polarella glacialis]|uniref:Calmodulin n=1 Tax=Polarella glacialis TaxID=89957 RepID=A0A813FG36_POLGL|nr:unnamed protein product [Polarella glacialis]
MHMNGIVHRDMRPENCILQDKSPEAEVKIIDFNSACSFENGKPLTEKVGSPYYIAPEVIAGSYGPKYDIWSCGVVLYIMLSGAPPFVGDTDASILEAVQRGEVGFEGAAWSPISQDAKALVLSMLTKHEDLRPNTTQALAHAWLKRGDPTGKQPLPSVVKKLQCFNSARRLKKICLTMIATQLQEKDLQELQKYFKSLDKNGDGNISKHELTQGLEYMSKSIPGFKPEDLEALSAGLDSDGSGSIDYTEFLAAAIDKQTYTQRDILWSSFRTLDVDGSGTIDKQELKKFLTTGDAKIPSMNDAKIMSMISETDVNGDGLIDFEEFVAMMKE